MRPRKVLAVRASWADENPDALRRLVRAHGRAAAFVEDVANRDEVTAMLSAPNRIGVAPEVIRRTLDGRMKVAPDGTMRVSDRYLLIGRNSAARPDPVQAAWLYAQMVRWGQAPSVGRAAGGRAKRCSGPTSTTNALEPEAANPAPASRRTASARSPGRPFDPDDIAAHLAAWTNPAVTAR